MNKQSGVSFQDWTAELRRIANIMGWTEPEKSIGEEDWKIYYEDNLTPAQAMLEDLNA